VTPSLTVVKLVIALVGLLVFGYGVRVDDSLIRWGGVALVALAWLLRFRKPKPDDREPRT
jgi:hypothetical protein